MATITFRWCTKWTRSSTASAPMTGLSSCLARPLWTCARVPSFPYAVDEKGAELSSPELYGVRTTDDGDDVCEQKFLSDVLNWYSIHYGDLGRRWRRLPVAHMYIFSICTPTPLRTLDHIRHIYRALDFVTLEHTHKTFADATRSPSHSARAMAQLNTVWGSLTRRGSGTFPSGCIAYSYWSKVEVYSLFQTHTYTDTQKHTKFSQDEFGNWLHSDLIPRYVQLGFSARYLVLELKKFWARFKGIETSKLIVFKWNKYHSFKCIY